MPTLPHGTNYPAIENAVSVVFSSTLGFPITKGDYSKLIIQTPMGVVKHGQLQAPLADRHPAYEWYHWFFPIELYFNYESDAEAHTLASTNRVTMVNTGMLHRFLDDGNTPYPQGYNGQAFDSKLIAAAKPKYFNLDGKDYMVNEYELYVCERIDIVYP